MAKSDHTDTPGPVPGTAQGRDHPAAAIEVKHHRTQEQLRQLRQRQQHA